MKYCRFNTEDEARATIVFIYAYYEQSDCAIIAFTCTYSDYQKLIADGLVSKGKEFKGNIALVKGYTCNVLLERFDEDMIRCLEKIYGCNFDIKPQQNKDENLKNFKFNDSVNQVIKEQIIKLVRKHGDTNENDCTLYEFNLEYGCLYKIVYDTEKGFLFFYEKTEYGNKLHEYEDIPYVEVYRYLTLITDEVETLE